MPKTKTKGQSIVELIIALLLVSVVLTAVVGIIIKGISNNTFNKNKSLSVGYTDEVLEWLRSERDKDWNQFYARTATSVWCLPTLSWSGTTHTGACTSSSGDLIPGTTYNRTITFQRISNPTISVNANVTVSWSDNNGTHNAESTTSFTNWKGNQ